MFSFSKQPFNESLDVRKYMLENAVYFNISKDAKIRNRYNQVPRLIQSGKWKAHS